MATWALFTKLDGLNVRGQQNGARASLRPDLFIVDAPDGLDPTVAAVFGEMALVPFNVHVAILASNLPSGIRCAYETRSVPLLAFTDLPISEKARRLCLV